MSMTDSSNPHGVPRLGSAGSLAGLPAGVTRPRYDRARLRPAIVHLGLGAFFRAHGAAYTEDVLAADPTGSLDWGILGASLQRPDQRDRLAPQDGYYTLIERRPEGPEARVIGSLLGVLVAPEDPAGLVARMAAPSTRIVSLTVTEKGYCHDPATGLLRADHPDVKHDLEHPGTPKTAPGFIVAALEARFKAGQAPFTVLTCDNLPGNGALVARLVRDMAALRDDGLAAWIEAEGAFPSTMVDRIVPAATEADIALAERLTGFYDAAPVAHEPFRQWVIEDRFAAAGRPAWENAGAQLVSDVAPFEHMKLRLLNGAHSAIAYLGVLAGLGTVREAVADPALRAFIEALWREEIVPAVPPPPGMDLGAYTAELMERFANPAIAHKTIQIAMDGSQKLPQRLLATVRERRRQGAPIGRIALVIAAWMHYLAGRDDNGGDYEIRDPMAAELMALATAGGAPIDTVRAFLGVGAVFGGDLAGDAVFASAIAGHLALLRQAGVKAAIGAAA
jgi:fructuronate reductase